MTFFPVFACEGQQGDMTGTLDSTCHLALVLGTCAGLTTRADLASISDELLQAIDLLVGDFGSLVPRASGGAAGRVAASSPPARAAVSAPSTAGASACTTLATGRFGT